MENFDRVLRLVYAAAVDNRRWNEALEALRFGLDAAAVVWASYDFEEKKAETIHAVGFEPEQARLYADVYAPLSPWLQSSEACTPGRVALGEELIANDALINSSFYREWLAPQNLFYSICAAVHQRDDRIFYIKALRRRVQGSFNDCDRDFLLALIPHLQRALEGSYQLWRLAVALDILGFVPFGVLTVDKRGRPLFANRLAEELLRGEEGLSIRNGKLCAQRAHISEQLEKLIAQAAATTAGKAAHRGGAVMIPRSQQGPALWAVVSPLGRHLRKVIAQENEVAHVFVTVPEQVNRLTGVMLRTYYGLTPAEQRVALMVLQGYRLDETAEKLQISRNTVHTHMKQIYAKTETDRQADLVRVLLLGPACQLHLASRDSEVVQTQVRVSGE